MDSRCGRSGQVKWISGPVRADGLRVTMDSSDRGAGISGGCACGGKRSRGDCLEKVDVVRIELDWRNCNPRDYGLSKPLEWPVVKNRARTLQNLGDPESWLKPRNSAGGHSDRGRPSTPGVSAASNRDHRNIFSKRPYGCLLPSVLVDSGTAVLLSKDALAKLNTLLPDEFTFTIHAPADFTFTIS